MALTRKLLESMGLESDKVSSIIEAHAETVDALKEKAEKYKTDAEKVASLEERITKLTNENEAYKAGDDWKLKYEELANDYEKYKTLQADKEITAQKTNAYKQLLIESGVSDKAIELIMRGADLKAIELEDGAIKGADKLVESFKTEYKDFIATTETKGAKVDTPPANDGSKKYSYEDISKMSPEQINANWSDVSKSLAQNNE